MQDFINRLILFLRATKNPNNDGFFSPLTRSHRVWIVIWIGGGLLLLCAVTMLLNLSVHMLYGFNLAKRFIDAGGAVATPLIRG